MNQFNTDCLADVHVHWRELEQMRALIISSLEGGADVALPMPNTTAGLISCEDVLKYLNAANQCIDALKKELPVGAFMNVLPCLALTENTTEQCIADCVTTGIRDCKIYPFDRTTKSEKIGVGHHVRVLPQVKWAGKYGMRVHLHPEHPSPTYNNREAEFTFSPILRMFVEETNAIIIAEHGTDGQCIPHWKELAKSGRFFVTITAHHLATNEDERFGDVRLVCKPPIKTERDRQDLLHLVAEDRCWVMAGTDTAPHNFAEGGNKHVHSGKCGCGAFTAPFAMPLYAHALHPILDLTSAKGQATFQNFTSRNARTLYGLPNSSRNLTLVQRSFTIPDSYEIAKWRVQPAFAKEMINWSLE